MHRRHHFCRYDGSPAKTVPGTQFIHEWVHHLRQQGYDIADASRGKPSLAAHGPALEAMQASLAGNINQAIAYGTHAMGEMAHKETAAKALSQAYDVAIDPRSIAFTPGGQMGLYIAFTLLHQACPSGKFISTVPGYLNYAELIGLATNTEDDSYILPLELQKSDGFRLHPHAIGTLIDDYDGDITALILCNPLNPTGQVFTESEWQEIAAIIKAHDFPVILDEAFAEIIFNDSQRSLFHIAPELLDRTFLFRSGTKAIGLSGERLAVTVVPERYIEPYMYFTVAYARQCTA